MRIAAGLSIVAGWVLLGSCAATPVAPSEAEGDGHVVFRGAADASAAVLLGDGTIAVADDEDNVLRTYHFEEGGAPRATVDLSGFLQLAGGAEADIEAAARVGDRIYWIGSHGRDRKGRVRAERQRFFATGTDLRPLGRPCTDLLPALARAIAAAGSRSTELDIEALGASPDGRTLWIGLRAPMVRHDGVDRVIAVPLRNPAAIVDLGARPELGAAVTWDLGGRTLRDMLGTASDDGLLLLAADRGDERRSRLYRWSGEPGDAPGELWAGGPPGLDGTPEALAGPLADGTVLLLTDDGDRPVAVRGAAECERGELRRDGTCRNKHLADPSRRSFRGFAVSP